jgi:lipoprotein-anchoring transpeptidase ErfK/SrfK
MTRAEIGRRQFLAGGITFVALPVAGCASIEAIPIIDGNADLKGSAEPRDVPPHVRAMYAAVSDEPFPIRASRVELVPERYWRQDVADPTGEAPGTVFVDTQKRFLYHVKDGGIATRYGVGIGRAGFGWSGKAHIAYKRAWPRWTPPSDMIAREPELEKYRHGMVPGPDNPLGPRTLYIHQGNTDTLYRIHGNPDERTVGQAVSSGCVRLLPQDIIHLYGEVRSGSTLLVV